MIDIPSIADFVATKGGLTKKVEWLSARLQALPVVLPEAGDYLVQALKKRQVLTIIGGEQA